MYCEHLLSKVNLYIFNQFLKSLKVFCWKINQSASREHLLGNRVNFPPPTSLKTRSGLTKDEDWWKTSNPKTFYPFHTNGKLWLHPILQMLKSCGFKIWDVSAIWTKFWKLLVLVWIKLTPPVVKTFQIISTQMSNQTTLIMTTQAFE